MIVLDTHAWFWLVTEHQKLSLTARQTLASHDEFGLCPISLWEIAMLERRERIFLDRSPADWIRSATAFPGLCLLPITPEIAAESAALSLPHGDPADRLIVATARTHQVPLVTKDGKITESGLVEVVW